MAYVMESIKRQYNILTWIQNIVNTIPYKTYEQIWRILYHVAHITILLAAQTIYRELLMNKELEMTCASVITATFEVYHGIFSDG
jgi:hypothetical protein